MTDIERLVRELRHLGHEVERVEDGALYSGEQAQLALFADRDPQEGGLIVRAHLDLDLFVDEDAMPEVLLGINLLNQTLDFGALNLEPLDDEDADGPTEGVTFAVIGRSVLLLADLGEAELRRLERHLTRFEHELTEAVERSLSGSPGLKA